MKIGGGELLTGSKLKNSQTPERCCVQSNEARWGVQVSIWLKETPEGGREA